MVISELMDVNIPMFLKKYFDALSDIEKKHIQSRISSIKSKYNSIKSLRAPKYFKTQVDPMFFCFEDLPFFGKEYWFMKFTPTTPRDSRQLLAMFGRTTEDIEINGKKIISKESEKSCAGFMSSWYFDQKKKDIVDDRCEIKISGRSIESNSINAKIIISGKFPRYNLIIKKGGKEVCNLEITKPVKDGDVYEFESFFKTFAGFALINLNFNFSGKLNGKKIIGKCYVQKVIVIGPLVPWYWGRITFENGSVLKYYLPRIELMGVDYKLLSQFNFYDSKTGKKHKFSGLNVKKLDGELPRFLISDSGGNISLIIDTYSSHKFTFKKIGTFNYSEFLGKVKYMYVSGKKIYVSKLGSGIGLVEEANGYVL